jgi:hypothetical protein
MAMPVVPDLVRAYRSTDTVIHLLYGPGEITASPLSGEYDHDLVDAVVDVRTGAGARLLAPA